MIIIDTPFHITFSCLNENPTYACTGKCKKSWWRSDLENRPTMGLCPQCQSGLVTASEGVHFKILKKSERDITASDFKEFKNIENEEMKKIEDTLKTGKKIAHLSRVKEKFLIKSLTEW